MPNTPIAISPVILQKLGLDPKTVEKVQKEKAQREETTLIAKKNGADTYLTFWQNPQTSIAAITLASGSLEISPVHSPNELLTTVEERLAEIDQSKKPPDLTAQIKAFMEGYGMTALEKKDFQTAITCLDYSSDNGILENDELIAKIKSATASEEELVKVAEIIEELKKSEPAKITTLPPAPPIDPTYAPPPAQTQVPLQPYQTDGQNLRPVPPPPVPDSASHINGLTPDGNF